MSYILEALRKSQQEREMTPAPVSGLEGFPGTVEPRGGNRWIVATTLLAVVAVGISLYAVFGLQVGGAPGDRSRSNDLQPALRTSGDEPDSAPDHARPAHSELASRGPISLPPLKQPGAIDGDPSDRDSVTRRMGSPPVVSPSGEDRRAHAARPGSTAVPAREVTAITPPEGPREAATSGPDGRHMTALATEEPPNRLVERDAQGGGSAGSDPPEPALPHWQQKSTGNTSEQATTGRSDDGASGTFRREAEQLRNRLIGVDRGATRDQRPRVPKGSGGDPGETPPQQRTAAALGTEAAATGTAAGARIPSAAELPAQLFKSLPPRNILVHVYNDRPDERFIILNSRRQTEGDTTQDGLVIEEIQLNGVVFRFRGERFFNPR